MSESAASNHDANSAFDVHRPLIRQRADPWIIRHHDGYYYFTASSPEYDRIELRRSWTLAGLEEAQALTVWRKHAEGPMSWHIWAPELHWIDGEWHIYFAAGEADKPWHIRSWILSNPSRDPFCGTWSEDGMLDTGWDSFTLDGTSFSCQGRRWFCWAQKSPGGDENTSLWLAPMQSARKLELPAIRISTPDREWECRGFKVNEGPAALIHNEKIFLTYSASATDHRYCMGMLEAREDADLMDPATWHKHPEPVLESDSFRNIWGPGHNSFTTTEDGKHDVLVYHARTVQEVSTPLFDPGRHTWLRIIRWVDGRPCFRPGP